MIARFWVPGPPKGKQRVKFTRVGKFVRTYTPKQTVDYEKLVGESYRKEFPNMKLEGPIEVSVSAFFPIPKSISKKKRESLIGQPHTKKPDCDNVDKSVLDGINGIAYEDDRQVCDLHTIKRYGEIPGIIVRLEELENKKPTICPLIFFDESGNEVDELFRRR